MGDRRTEGRELVVPDDDAIFGRLRIRGIGRQFKVFLHVLDRALVVLRLTAQRGEVELALHSQTRER